MLPKIPASSAYRQNTSRTHRAFSTLNPETRRSGGMHYTSIENIHKVIDPLFLDGLRAELASSAYRQNTSRTHRAFRLFSVSSVSGSLYCFSSEVPPFTEELKTLLLERASEDFDWSAISNLSLMNN